MMEVLSLNNLFYSLKLRSIENIFNIKSKEKALRLPSLRTEKEGKNLCVILARTRKQRRQKNLEMSKKKSIL